MVIFMPPIILEKMYRKSLNNKGIIDNNAFIERQPSFLDGVLRENRPINWR